jgi:PAS domain S-box-containing protein
VGLTSSVTGHGSFEVRLPPQPSSVAEARAHVRRLLVEAGRDDLAETAVLLVSEVVTNALLHAGTDIDLAATLNQDGLLVQVGDGSPHLPSRRRYAATAGTGRGLLMLESLVDDWGVTARPAGKTVWFRISGPENDLPDENAVRTDQPGTPRQRRDNVSVELQNMPLLLHAAWQEHAEALLREYLLVSLDSVGDDPIQVHADATDAIAVLEEHVPRTAVTMTADELMGDAVEPTVSARMIQVPVPLGLVAHFETLDRAIEAALDLSNEGLVLTPPTQPEVHAFRRWICRQVLSQAAGRPPEPWRTPEDALGPTVVLDGWDASAVTEATTGLIAADATSRILAVSRVAAEILGYDDPRELAGRRILSIVPERYRQAHVAGFTMYLLVGRKPLLDHTVVLPALRRDGRGVQVQLTVRTPTLGNGQTVLLADIRVSPADVTSQ